MSKQFFGGLPTEIDVRKLNESFPVITEGDEITHDQIESLLGIKRTDNRYRTVTTSWRRSLLREKGIELSALLGIGFRCLNAEERVTGGIKRFEGGTRKQLRAVKSVVIVKTSAPELIRRQDLMRRYGAAIASEANAMIKEIEPPKPIEQSPRRIQIKKAA